MSDVEKKNASDPKAAEGLTEKTPLSKKCRLFRKRNFRIFMIIMQNSDRSACIAQHYKRYIGRIIYTEFNDYKSGVCNDCDARCGHNSNSAELFSDISESDCFCGYVAAAHYIIKFVSHKGWNEELFMKKHKNRIISVAACVLILTFVYWWGGNAPSLHGWSVSETPQMTVFVPQPEELHAVEETPQMTAFVPSPPPEAEQSIKKPGENETAENKPQKSDNTPIYNSAYIEGIANLYEFDCGELSGWMYKVNGWFPNYGCSRYRLTEGDVVEWVYTCDLGNDVGGYFVADAQKDE